jgi:hypothetical protein
LRTYEVALGGRAGGKLIEAIDVPAACFGSAALYDHVWSIIAL